MTLEKLLSSKSSSIVSRLKSVRSEKSMMIAGLVRSGAGAVIIT